MRFKRQAPQEEVFINLVSFIDVLLVLIIFLMLSTTFKHQSQLKVELPQANGDVSQELPQEVQIIISQDGEYEVNDRRLVNRDRETLVKALKDVSNGDNRMPVTVMADANARHQAVVTAMEVAGQLGFTQLRIATRHSEAK
ncbi:MAG TPA: biopolymer transporter ExbD [Dongiaceae bacterium]|nr:biopolymer transporter ExbD [Dongiaceae bacterium]